MNMNCEVIKDLMPLYIDQCCSAESDKLVSDHLENCVACRNIYNTMVSADPERPMVQHEPKLRSVSSWKASVLQSCILFLSFAVMTLGVILEGNTPTGSTNGLWAVALIVPATAYLLSLGNWFFVRVYKNRKQFSNGSGVATLILLLLGYLWAWQHYDSAIVLTSPLIWLGAGLGIVFCILSKILSDRYALLLGKE